MSNVFMNSLSNRHLVHNNLDRFLVRLRIDPPLLSDRWFTELNPLSEREKLLKLSKQGPGRGSEFQG